jgi:hypothetical protein
MRSALAADASFFPTFDLCICFTALQMRRMLCCCTENVMNFSLFPYYFVNGTILIGLGLFQFCFSQLWKNYILTNYLCPGEEY